MNRHVRAMGVGIMAAAALVAAVVVRAVPGSPPASAGTAPAEAPAVVDGALRARLAAGESTDAIVIFEPGTGKAAMEAAIATAGTGARVLAVWPDLATAHVLFSRSGAIAAVAAGPAVRAIQPNVAYRKASQESRVVVNQPAAEASGFTGEGTTVAVLDTGARCADLPRRDGACPVVWAEDFAPDDGAEDDDDHGTNVAAIVLAVAPRARIAALDVFHETDEGDQLVATNDALAAIQRVIERRAELNIVAVNLSLGGGLVRNVLRCPLSPYASAFVSLRANGILPVVAAGNSAYEGPLFFNGVADPACAPGALVVGAVYDDAFGPTSWPQGGRIFTSPLWPRSECTDPETGPNRVTCFSQTASFLGVLAPGARITAGGVTMSGTSQATPHVAGAVALLAQAAPASTVNQREAAIVSSGQLVRDTRSNALHRRLELCGALNGVGAACGGPAGVSFARQAAPEDGWRYYYVDVAAGANLLTVAADGSSGDIDLYVGTSYPPTRQTARCVREGPAEDETCVVANPAGGRWWVGVYGFEEANFTLSTAASSVQLVRRAALPFVASDASFGGR